MSTAVSKNLQVVIDQRKSENASHSISDFHFIYTNKSTVIEIAEMTPIRRIVRFGPDFLYNKSK